MIILAAAQEVGGANVLIPVIEELVHRGDTCVAVLAGGKAVAAFSASGIEHASLNFPADAGQEYYDKVYRHLVQVGPDALLLGTALGPSLDKSLVRAAQEREIPALSVLDMWSNYRERFTEPASGELRLPTKVAVMDGLAFDQAVEAGLPASKLVVTGQPHLQALAERISGPGLAAKAASLRHRWLSGVQRPENTRLVMFASEAVSRDFGPGTPYYPGYTEFDALEGLVEAVNRVESLTSWPIKVVAKLHPEESDDSFLMCPRTREARVIVVADQPAWPCILAADVVVGMRSMFLLESAIAGRPSVSFQPGVTADNSFIGSRMGMVLPASSTTELASILTGLLREGRAGPGGAAIDAARPLEFMKEGAARRIGDLVLELAISDQGRPRRSVP